jgi:putative membrane protein
VKLAAVLGLSGFQGLLGRHVRLFAADRNAHSGRYFRMINEVPTVAMIVIVIMVIVKPF